MTSLPTAGHAQPLLWRACEDAANLCPAVSRRCQARPPPCSLCTALPAVQGKALQQEEARVGVAEAVALWERPRVLA